VKKLYLNKKWLKNEIHNERRSYDEIAALCNVAYGTIKRHALKFSIGIGRAKGKSKKFKRTPIIKPINGEKWKICKVIHRNKLITFNDYMISNYGRIKRITPDRNSVNKTWIGKKCETRLNKDGYHRLTLSYYDGVIRKQIVIYVARLVAHAFLGPCPEGMEVNHKFGNKDDNRSSKLEYMTRSGNVKHAFDNGLNKNGSKHYFSKLNEEKVCTIRKLAKRKNRPKNAELAAEFKVNESTICNIINYPDDNWRHVKV
jgi:hypothetical protein